MEKQNLNAAPRHWVDLDELTPDYWNSAQEQEKRGQEFFHKPIETLEKIEKLDTQGIARRDFLTLMGASIALATAACARRPVHKIIPYVVKPEEITPGVANYYASVYPYAHECSGLLIKCREGRPIKLEGNPEDPITQGKLGTQGQASLLELYDPERLKGPLKVQRASGLTQEVSWAQANADISKRLRSAKSLRVLTSALVSNSERKVLQDFLSSHPGSEHIEYDALHDNTFAEGQQVCFGEAVMPEYLFDRADLVLSFGADFLGTWTNAVAHRKLWGKKRKLASANAAHAKMSKLICVEPTMSVTATNSDERVLVASGDEYKVALALVGELLKGNSSAAGSAASVLSSYSAEAVAKDSGGSVTAEKIREIAHALSENRGKSIVLAGGISAQSENGLALQIAVNWLNSILGNEGKTILGNRAPQTYQVQKTRVMKLLEEMRAGKVDALVIAGTNPAYSFPESFGFKENLSKIGIVVTLASHLDETASRSDYALGASHYLESWGDVEVRRGLHYIQQPVIAPLFDTRSLGETILGWMEPGKDQGMNAHPWYDYVRANWKAQVHAKHGRGAGVDDFWNATLQKGFVDARSSSEAPRAFRSAALANLTKFSGRPVQQIRLALYASSSLQDGRPANNGWLQELPDPVSTITWDNYLNVSPKLAKELGLSTNDVARVKSGAAEVELPVVVQPGMHASTVSVAVGYGRERSGKVGTGVGVNTFGFREGRAGQWVAAGLVVAVTKTGRRYELGLTQNHHRTENRPIINDLTLSEFQKNPGEANHTDPHLRLPEIKSLWSGHKYDGPYRWGMAIDLSSCTGCGACTVACQAENNVPIVGREGVRYAREMHWIRIDRYYSGSEDNPDVVYQPMLCQHCENASCETVCPVLATVHNDEGLNEMVYNRCVGTRYCQNNCPYKVRRFNYFDYWKNHQDQANLVWNPDVTVRTRGIMEKCSFCTQRIQEKKLLAKSENRLVRDGEIITACQQTCASEAIVFGNLNDPKSRVSQLQKEAHSFRALEILNNKPQIAYLSKVRNKQKERTEHDGQHHG